jgi:hypothetical protein
MSAVCSDLWRNASVITATTPHAHHYNATQRSTHAAHHCMRACAPPLQSAARHITCHGGRHSPPGQVTSHRDTIMQAKDAKSGAAPPPVPAGTTHGGPAGSPAASSMQPTGPLQRRSQAWLLSRAPAGALNQPHCEPQPPQPKRRFRSAESILASGQRPSPVRGRRPVRRTPDRRGLERGSSSAERCRWARENKNE